MCKYVNKKDIVDELLSVKSRSKRDLMMRAVRVIYALRDEAAILRRDKQRLADTNVQLMHKAHELERAFRDVNKLCEERGATEERLEEQLREVETQLDELQGKYEKLVDWSMEHGAKYDKLKADVCCDEDPKGETGVAGDPTGVEFTMPFTLEV